MTLSNTETSLLKDNEKPKTTSTNPKQQSNVVMQEDSVFRRKKKSRCNFWSHLKRKNQQIGANKRQGEVVVSPCHRIKSIMLIKDQNDLRKNFYFREYPKTATNAAPRNRPAPAAAKV
jgi:hypothetical protein